MKKKKERKKYKRIYGKERMKERKKERREETSNLENFSVLSAGTFLFVFGGNTCRKGFRWRRKSRGE